jgi:hypothetical protein
LPDIRGACDSEIGRRHFIKRFHEHARRSPSFLPEGCMCVPRRHYPPHTIDCSNQRAKVRFSHTHRQRETSKFPSARCDSRRANGGKKVVNIACPEIPLPQPAVRFLVPNTLIWPTSGSRPHQTYIVKYTILPALALPRRMLFTSEADRDETDGNKTQSPRLCLARRNPPIRDRRTRRPGFRSVQDHQVRTAPRDLPSPPPPG